MLRGSLVHPVLYAVRKLSGEKRGGDTDALLLFCKEAKTAALFAPGGLTKHLGSSMRETMVSLIRPLLTKLHIEKQMFVCVSPTLFSKVMHI